MYHNVHRIHQLILLNIYYTLLTYYILYTLVTQKPSRFMENWQYHHVFGQKPMKELR